MHHAGDTLEAELHSMHDMAWDPEGASSSCQAVTVPHHPTIEH